jgi:hypothetical protein
MTNADPSSYDRNRVVDLEHRVLARMAARSYERTLVVDREHRVLARIALDDHSSSKTNIENDRDRCSRVEWRGSSLTSPLTWEPSPDIEFVDGQGNKHLCKSSYWTTWNQWPVGSQVDVTYDPNDPTNCELVLPRGMVVMLMLVGISFAFMAAHILYDALQSMWG